MDIHFVENATFDTDADDLRPPEPGFESKNLFCAAILNGCLQLGNSREVSYTADQITTVSRTLFSTNFECD